MLLGDRGVPPLQTGFAELVQEVGLQRDCQPSAGADRGGRFVGAGGRGRVMDRDIKAARAEIDRHRAPEPPACAGDERPHQGPSPLPETTSHVA